MTRTISTTDSRRHTGIARLLQLVASIGLIAALVLMRPTMPDFGPSLKTPLTTSTLTRLAVVLLWGICLLLALALLQRALLPTRTLRPPAWATRTGPRRRRRAHLLTRRDAPPAPRLVLPSRGADTADLSDRTDDTPADAAVLAMIRLLGPVSIDGIRRPRRAGTIELLAYLALHQDGASRDRLLEALWPGEDPRRTRPRLWHAVSEARRLLGDAFERNGDRYQLDHTRVRTDSSDLEHLLHAADHATSPKDTACLLEQALTLWRGTPLADTDYAWSESHARQLEARLATLAERAAHARLEAGDPGGALRVAERGLELDELNETFMRLILESEAALGQREALVDRYEAFRRQLDETLGLEPERETRLLYRCLLAAD
jgi:DNA-binding SARP family transcriptional activator